MCIYCCAHPRTLVGQMGLDCLALAWLARWPRLVEIPEPTSRRAVKKTSENIDLGNIHRCCICLSDMCSVAIFGSRCGRVDPCSIKRSCISMCLPPWSLSSPKKAWCQMPTIRISSPATTKMNQTRCRGQINFSLIARHGPSRFACRRCGHLLHSLSLSREGVDYCIH